MPPDPAALLAADRRLRALVTRLVADARAEEVVQEAWLAALQHGQPIHSLAGWLGTVARRLALRGHRADARRSAREGAVAVPDELPSTADILAREETRARVVEAVLALEEPLRTTIVLRFLEDLPPRVVARRMRVPVETVRARTRSALELLRRRLDRSLGSREGRLGALLPLALPRSSAALALAAMTLPTKLTVSAAALALLAALFWPRAGHGEGVRAVEPEAAPQIVALPDPSEGAPEEPARADALPVSDARSPVAPPPASAPLTSATGAVRVHVTWKASDHEPLEDCAGFVVRVLSEADENPELHAREAVTDSAGIARFEDLPAGGARVSVDRRFVPPHAERVVIVAGATAEHGVRLTGGFTVLGRVTDEADRPVAGAEIWFGKFPDLAHGTLVARSAADGSFRLEALSHANLGARAPGHRPSRIAYLYASDGAEVPVELVLRSGAGEVRGTVLGTSGEPLEGALVRVGPPGPADPGFSTMLDADWGTLARTGADGRFAVAGVAAGLAPVVVRSAGYALYRGEVEVVDGGTAELTAILAAEPVLAGHVRDALGAPVAEALVTVGEEAGPFRASARSDAGGAFRVGALEAGRTYGACVAAGPGVARTEFLAAAGETHAWEAVLEPLGTVHGIVVDERGAPIAGWGVRLCALDPQIVDDEGYVLAGADGRFRFDGLTDRAHVLTVEAPGSGLTEVLVRRGVRPSEDELVLRVSDDRRPSARIVGTLLDEAGRALPTAQVFAWFTLAARASVETCDPLSGRFELGPYPPGEVRLILRASGRGTLVRKSLLAAGETWDLGEIRLVPEGRLRVHLLAAGVEPDERVTLACRPGWFDPFEGGGAERLSPPLAPGAYTLEVVGGEVEELALPFTIASGAETELDVPLRRGWRTPIAVRAADDVPLASLRVSLPGGTTLERHLHERVEDTLVGVLHLAPGTYPVEVSDGPHHASGTLVVEPVDRDEPVLVLALE